MAIRTRLSLLAVLSAAWLTNGCAEERAPINRVQPNALEKTFFVGEKLSDPSDNPEFYYRPTVVDVDYGASQSGLFTASYAQTLARVAWEVTEDLLVARLTYERVQDTSGKGSPDDAAGQIVAAFKIESHFDIRRAYNPQTGEELNIVEENTDDRAWYERRFMRVDFSQNLVTAAYELDTLAALKAYSDQPIEYEPATYSVEDPKNPDAPVFEAETGYFDVTNKVFAKPQMLDTPWGSYPACMFNADFFGGSGPTGNCNPVELKVRLSFMRVTDTDYEAVDWDGHRQAMFGAFTTGTLNPQRYGYDRSYGVVDSKWRRFASRHNIWQRSHAQGADGGPIRCTTNEACDTAAGSRCDVHSGACTLPYRERAIKPIVYYYGPGSDPTLFEAMEEVAADWDSALRHAVQTARYAECVRTSGGVADQSASAACAESFPTSQQAANEKVERILHLCHNPVTKDDAPACGAPGLAVRVGDLRYHMANIIQSPQDPSPWGIMADASDPITGEVVASSINVWNHVTDLQAQRLVDRMRWYLGELSSADIQNGAYVKERNRVARVTETGALSRGPAPLSTQEISERLGAMDTSLLDPTLPVQPPRGNARELFEWASASTRSRYGDSVLGSGNATIQSRLLAARGSPVEAKLLTQPYLSLSGLDHSVPVDERVRDAASPLRGNFWHNRMGIERDRQLRLADAGRCVLEAAEPTGLIELGKSLLRKFGDEGGAATGSTLELTADQLRARNQKWADYVRRRITRGVMAHEMGHSIGLRHVFTSSFDALNYRPQYWQLRTRDKQETAPCTAATANGENCIGPRYYDPVTEAEREGMLTRWQQTSVMDYPGEMTQEMLDIGPYDRAAVRFLYGDVVEMWDDPSARCSVNAAGAVTACSPNGMLLANELDSFGGIQGPYYGVVTSWDQAKHYSQLDQTLNLIRDCRPADTSPPADWDEAKNGVWDPVLDGQIVGGTQCSGVPVDYVAYDDLSGVTTFDGVVRKFDARGRVRRPYMFASDEYADIGNIAVYRSDNGADAYEVASFLINDYEDAHVFDNHRRGRTSFTYSGAFSRSYSRYHAKLKEMTKGYALLHEIYAGSGTLDTLMKGDGLSKPHALASSLVFDHFTRMLTRPTSGEHFLADPDALGNVVLRSTDQSLSANQPNQAATVVLPEGTQTPGQAPAMGGRPLHNALDGAQGYYATDYDLWVGSYYDKTLALDLLADSTDRFISQSRDDFQDGRYRNVSLATLFPDGVRRLVGTALTEDGAMLGWRIPSSGGQPRVARNSRTPQAPLGFRVWWPQSGPETCWPAPGQLGCIDYGTNVNTGMTPPAESLPIDPEVGFEVQKFIVFFSLLYLPESWKRDWVDLLRIYQLGADSNPAFPLEESVVFRDPLSGERFVAHAVGRETLDGREVERGIGARVLQWANTLAERAYVVSAVEPVGGELIFERYTTDSVCPRGQTCVPGQPVQKDLTYVARLRNYKSVIEYMRQTTGQLGFYGPSWRGVY